MIELVNAIGILTILSLLGGLCYLWWQIGTEITEIVQSTETELDPQGAVWTEGRPDVPGEGRKGLERALMRSRRHPRSTADTRISRGEGTCRIRAHMVSGVDRRNKQ